MAYASEIKHKTRDTIEDAGDAAKAGATSAGESMKAMSRDVSHAVETATEVAQEKIDTMAAYVKRNPLQATAIAAGVGFVFALLARR